MAVTVIPTDVDRAADAERRRHHAAQAQSRRRIDELRHRVARLEAELAQTRAALRRAHAEREHALAGLARRAGG
jgi:uncharacterized protein YceH (UPF0502 family)